MKSVPAIAMICLLAGCLGGGSGASTDVTKNETLSDSETANTDFDSGVSTPSSVASVGAYTQADSTNFASLLNGVRASNGAGTISYDPRLAVAAQLHSKDQLAMGVMTHTGSDGSNAGQRITRQGYNWRAWGENVARGQQSEQEVFEDWSDSPGHHANNINPVFEDFGIAKAGSGSQTYWTLVLAAEQ